LHGRLTLTDAQVERFSVGIRALFQRERETHLFEIFTGNLREFESLLLKVREGLEQKRISDRDLAPIQREADRRVLNVLTAMRTCLDHWETILTRRHGKDSPEAARFKDACSREYDRHFAYRFAYKLRNYAQHCGLPVGDIRLVSRSRVFLLDPSGGPTKRMVSPSKDRDEAVFRFRRSDLLDEYDGWGTLHAELAARHADIDVARQLRAMAQALNRINVKVLAISARRVRAHASYLRGLMELVRDEDSRRVPIVFSFRHGARARSHIKLRHFPISQMRDLLPRDTYLQALP
jgi:hypothetical protein